MTAQQDRNRLLVVLGATGHQGGSVLKHFTSQPSHSGFRLRGITRNTNSEGSRDLEKLGVEMVRADLDDVSSLLQAFSGATHIFATTDSNYAMFDAIQHPEKMKPGQTPPEYGTDIEKGYGHNIAEAAAATTTLERIVWSGLPGPARLSKGRYTRVAMFDAKETIGNMLQAKTELSDKLSTLLIGFYAENALMRPELYGPRKQPDGVYELSLPMSSDSPVPFADVDSDAGRWVAALFNASPGLKLVGASEVLTWNQWLALWGKRNGVATRFRKASEDQFAQDMVGLQDAIVEEFKFVEDFGFTGGDPELLYPGKLRQKGVHVETSTISDHIARRDWSSVL